MKNLTKLYNSDRILLVMPHYNEIDYIEETLNSIFSQTYNSFDLHIFDNFSNDGSLNIIRKFQSKDKRIVLHESNSNVGLLGNFDRVYKFALKSNYDYFILIQADDLFAPIFLEVLYKNIVSFPDAVLSLVNIATIDSYNQIIRYYPDFSRFKIRNQILRSIYFINEPESLGKCNTFLGLVRINKYRDLHNNEYLINNAFDNIIAFNLIKFAIPQTDDRVLHFKRNDHVPSSKFKNYYSQNHQFDQIFGHISDINILKFLVPNYMRSLNGINETISLMPFIFLKTIYSVSLRLAYGVYIFLRKIL